MSSSQIQKRPIEQRSTDQIEDMFQVMQQRFDSSFNQPFNLQLSKTNKQQIKTSHSKQNLRLSARSGRKVKPQFASIQQKNKQNGQNSSLRDSPDTKNLNSRIHIQNNEQSSPSNNQGNGGSNTSSPIGKICTKFKQPHEMQENNCESHNPTNKEQQNQNSECKPKNPNNLNQNNANQQNLKPSSALDYSDLQQKIQSALKKNSKYKQFSSSSRLSKSNFTNKSFSQFNQMMLSRFQECQKKKCKQIQRKKQQLQCRNQKQLKFHPKINKKSEKFLEQMGGHQSIQHRYEKIIQAKNKKMKENEELKIQKQQEEYERFMQEFSKSQKSPEESTRSYDQFYEQMLKWKEKSNRSTQEKKRLQQEKQLNNANKFQPKMNKKSQKILLNSAKVQKRVPIYEREIPSQKKFKSKIDEQCTFKPKINKKKEK